MTGVRIYKSTNNVFMASGQYKLLEAVALTGINFNNLFDKVDI